MRYTKTREMNTTEKYVAQRETSGMNFSKRTRAKRVFLALRYCKARKYRRTETLTYENKTATTFDEKATMLTKVLFSRTKT